MRPQLIAFAGHFNRVFVLFFQSALSRFELLAERVVFLGFLGRFGLGDAGFGENLAVLGPELVVLDKRVIPTVRSAERFVHDDRRRRVDRGRSVDPNRVWGRIRC